MYDFWLALLTLIYMVNEQEKSLRATHSTPTFDEDAFDLEMLAYLEATRAQQQTATQQAQQAVGLTYRFVDFPAASPSSTSDNGNMFSVPGAPALDPPVNPTEGYVSLTAAEDYIRRYARDRGFGISRQRSNVDKRKVVRKVFIQCDRAGICSSKARTRKSTSRKSNCPWKVILKRMDGAWFISNNCLTHNHEMGEAIAHNCHRTRGTEIQARVYQMSEAGLAPKEICAALSQEKTSDGEPILIRPRDVYNIRAKLRRQRDAGSAFTTMPT